MPKKDDKTANAEKKMIAVEPVLHDGERIEPGEPFTCDAKQADRHLKHGTAKKGTGK